MSVTQFADEQHLAVHTLEPDKSLLDATLLKTINQNLSSTSDASSPNFSPPASVHHGQGQKRETEKEKKQDESEKKTRVSKRVLGRDNSETTEKKKARKKKIEPASHLNHSTSERQIETENEFADLPRSPELNETCFKYEWLRRQYQLLRHHYVHLRRRYEHSASEANTGKIRVKKSRNLKRGKKEKEKDEEQQRVMEEEDEEEEERFMLPDFFNL